MSAADKYRQCAAEGFSQAATATRLGVSRAAVRHMANRHGIVFDNGRIDHDKRVALAELHEQGLTDKKISERLGVTVNSVCNMRQRMGLKANRAPTWAEIIEPLAKSGHTLTEASKITGLSAQNVWSIAHNAGIEFHTKERLPRTVRVGSEVFPSLSAAARHFRCSPQNARYRAMSPNFPDWELVE